MSQPGKKNASGVDNTVRSTWDKEEYRKKAEERAKTDKEQAEMDARELKNKKRKERDPLHQGVITERAALSAREYKLNLDARLGKTQVIGNTTANSQQAGYYCSVCDCVLKDSITYLDHINGKWHQRALGISMRVDKSSADNVREKLAAMKKKKEDAAALQGKDALQLFDRKVEKAAQEEEARRAQEAEERKRRKLEEKEAKEKEKAAEEAGEEGAEDDEIARMMGFGAFGGGKK